MDFDAEKDREGAKILENENEVFADLIYQNGLDYGSKLMSFIAMDDEDRWANLFLKTFQILRGRLWPITISVVTVG